MNNVYQDYSLEEDEILIERLRSGEDYITDYIMNKYKNMVRQKARTLFMLGGDSDDLIQEGMIGLFKAIRDYRREEEASFATFADICVSRQMYSAITASNRLKHKPLNNYISLHMEQVGDYGADSLLECDIVDTNQKNPEELLIDKENISRLHTIIEKELSPFEKQVLNLYIDGAGYVEIARVLGRDDKATDNAIQRIRRKLKIWFSHN